MGKAKGSTTKRAKAADSEEKVAAISSDVPTGESDPVLNKEVSNEADIPNASEEIDGLELSKTDKGKKAKEEHAPIPDEDIKPKRQRKGKKQETQPEDLKESEENVDEKEVKSKRTRKGKKEENESEPPQEPKGKSKTRGKKSKEEGSKENPPNDGENVTLETMDVEVEDNSAKKGKRKGKAAPKKDAKVTESHDSPGEGLASDNAEKKKGKSRNKKDPKVKEDQTENVKNGEKLVESETLDESEKEFPVEEQSSVKKGSKRTKKNDDQNGSETEPKQQRMAEEGEPMESEESSSTKGKRKARHGKKETLVTEAKESDLEESKPEKFKKLTIWMAEKKNFESRNFVK